MKAQADTLRRAGWSVFAGRDAQALGRPLAEAGDPLPAVACSGTITAMADPALGEGGARAEGVVRGALPAHVLTLLLADGRGRVAGIGSTDRRSGETRHWNGYVKVEPGGIVRAYARLRDRQLCYLGEAAVAAPAP